MTLRRWGVSVTLAFGLVFGGPGNARAGEQPPTGAVIEAARAFEEAALRINDVEPARLVRWTRPIYLAVSQQGAMATVAAEAEAAVRQLAGIARVAVHRVAFDDPRANFVIRQAEPGGRAACRAGINWQDSHITSVEIHLWLDGRGSRTRCINHEVMHGFGFRSHAHGAKSILSYRQARITEPSALDRAMLETLYDGRLQPGMDIAATLSAACIVLAEKHRLPSHQAAASCRDLDVRERHIANRR